MATLEPACPNCGEMMLDGRSHLTCQSRRERIASLQRTVGEQADQIGGLTSELEKLRDAYTATAELLQIREEQVQQLLKDVSDSQQQLAESQAEAAALTQLVNGFTRREDALKATLTDDDILVYLADVELPRPAAEHIAEFSVMVFREGMARVALATPSAAAERVQALDATIRECLEGIIDQRIGDLGRCVTLNCDCSECLARTALAALDAATGEEALTVEGDNAISTQSVSNSDAIAAEKE